MQHLKIRSTLELTEILPETVSNPVNLSNPEKLAEKCIELSKNLSKIWATGDNYEKQALQKLVFVDRIYYNTENTTYRTTQINYVFSQMAQLSGDLKDAETKNPLKNQGILTQ